MTDTFESADGAHTAGAALSVNAPYVPWTRARACRRCHSRKVKCSGGQPCKHCRQADKAAECSYPQKDRLVKVSQQYIDELIAENRRLQRRASKQPRLHSDPPSGDAVESARDVDDHSTAPSIQIPELATAPWFINLTDPHTPILLAEASDSAFATRFRQAMSDSKHSHLPRVNYPSDDHLLYLSDSACDWPSPSQARLLINAAIKCLGRWHHIVRRSVILEELEQSLQCPRSVSCLLQSKLWALFAIGRMYSTRTSAAPKAFPGLEYFCKATKILRVTSERPMVEMVETWILLSYYSLCLNRRHSAYSLAGSAVRVAIIMGLHLKVPESLLTDPVAREHRIRVWWAAYIFDRMWATKVGYPAAIQDGDIELDLPSNKHSDKDLEDSAYSIAMIELARISGQITQSVYSRSPQKASLSQRVHDSLSALRKWHEKLPPAWQMDSTRDNPSDQQAESLHLLFNQLVILATRSVLLHVFRTNLKAVETGSTLEIPASASALADACVRCARHSSQILTNAWIGGTFMMFDYFYTQYLFAVATVLAISSLMDGKDGQADRESFETAADFLSQLKDSGNFVAAEFNQHAEAMKALFASVETKMHSRNASAASYPVVDTEDGRRNEPEPIAMAPDIMSDMVLAEPFFYDLLSQPALDIEFIDASISVDSSQGFYWPVVLPGSDSETFY